MNKCSFNEITDKIFLGDNELPKNKLMLDELKIEAVVNLTTAPNNVFENIVQYHCPIHDRVNTGIDWIEQAAKFVDEQISLNKRTYVHCAAGMSRSPTLVIYYLMTRNVINNERLSLKDAYDHVFSKRDMICPNIGFINKLIQVETNENKEKSLSEKQYVLTQTHRVFPTLSFEEIESVYQDALETVDQYNKLKKPHIHPVGYLLIDLLKAKYPKDFKPHKNASKHHPFN